MFNFPWTNFHELNLDWILSVVKEAKEVFDDGRADIDYAVDTADEAKEIATQAAEATIPDNSISTSKLQNASVTHAKLANNSVTTDNIVDRTIIGNDIAENTIESYNIKNGTIIGADIADTTITADKIANATITGTKIADGTITKNLLSTAVQTAIDAVRTIVVHTGSATLDGYGRFSIGATEATLVNVIVHSTSYVCLPRYSTSGILVYVYDLTTLNPITTQPTVDYTYITVG